MMNNEPTKTKKAMKTIKFLSMAALALVGAMMTGCSSDDNIIDTPQQPENTGNVVTLTTTVGLNEGAEARGTTRALGIDYENKQAVKTFAAGETMAIVYKNKSGNTVKAVSAALTDGDITTTADPATNKKSATFTFELTDPDKTKPVMYIYPAAMAKASIATDATIDEANTVDYTNLDAQNGTLATLSSSLDLATYAGAWDGISLPAGTLVNQLAVCALTLKDNATPTPNTITSDLTQVTVSDGSNTYTVTPTSSTFGEDVIYVAIRPVTAALEYTATDGTKNYTKTATSREYAAGNFYNLGLRMVETVPAAKAAADATAEDIGKIVGADGKIYDTKDAAEAVATGNALAMIAYVGTASDCDHGLAIALENVSSSSTYSWGDAAGAVTTWASGKTPPTTGSWRLPSIKDWQYMIIGCEGSGSYSEYPVQLSYNGLREKLSAAGGTALTATGSNALYWLSTEDENDPEMLAWALNFYDWDGNAYFYDGNMKDDVWLVRACLAF
jgi:hypothetical protein